MSYQNDEAPMDDSTISEHDESASTETATEHVDIPVETAQVPSIDYQALYRESLQYNRSIEQKLDSLNSRMDQNAPKPQERELTDDDLERMGTVPVIKQLIQNTLRKELSESMGDFQQIGQEWKRTKLVENAENQFFRANPQLGQYRDQLAQIVRPSVMNGNNISPESYAQAAYATVGAMFINNSLNAPASVSTPTPPRSAPVTNGRTPTTPTSAPRISELERRGMRNVGMDPNNASQVKEFLDMVNNDGGVEMK
jgi:hypothetical protein